MSPPSLGDDTSLLGCRLFPGGGDFPREVEEFRSCLTVAAA